VEDTGIEPVTFRLPVGKHDISPAGNGVASSGFSWEKCHSAQEPVGTETARIEPTGGLQNGLHRIECADLEELAILWQKIPQTVRDSWLVTARALADLPEK
jgi:hypothetical protein